MPRPPGSVVPRRPRAPDQRGEELEPESTPEQISRRKFSWRGLTIFFLALGGCSVKFFFPRNAHRAEDEVPDRPHRRLRVRPSTTASSRSTVSGSAATRSGSTSSWRSARTSAARRTGSRRRTSSSVRARVGYDSGGINFEGPAPKPMQRCHVELAPDGQIIVDKLVVFDEADHGFDKPGAYLPLS